MDLKFQSLTEKMLSQIHYRVSAIFAALTIATLNEIWISNIFGFQVDFKKQFKCNLT